MPGKCQVDHEKDGWTKIKGNTGEEFFVVRDIDKKSVESDLRQLQKDGINSIAVVLAHSYAVPDFEITIGNIAQELGFNHISLSHEVIPMVKIVPRGFTSCVDAYLTPHIKRYLHAFTSGFHNNLEGTKVLFMQSDGGLTHMNAFSGSRAILSGPAGGVVGYGKNSLYCFYIINIYCSYAVTTWQKETDLPVIGFDMGGTSTDVSRYAGSYEHVYETMTAGVCVQAPQLDVNTVAAGGGSILCFRYYVIYTSHCK